MIQRRQKMFWILLLGVLFVPTQAYAYIDPGIGVVVWQLALAFVIGFFYQLRSFPRRLWRQWRGQPEPTPLTTGATAERVPPPARLLLPFQKKKTESLRSLTLRDPAGQLFEIQGRLIRFVFKEGDVSLQSLLQSPAVKKFVTEGKIVTTYRVAKLEAPKFSAMAGQHLRSVVENSGAVVEHSRVPFPSFPAEWPPEMLHEAAYLTLELAEKLIDEDLGLKDATPLNVLFDGPNAVFTDVLSIEKRRPNNPTWNAYGQFIRTFLSPLLMNRYFNATLASLFLSHSDGIEAAEVYAFLNPLQRLLPPFLSLVTLPTWLSRRGPSAEIYRERTVSSSDAARYVLRTVIRQLRRHVDRLKPKKNRISEWSDYVESLQSGRVEDIQCKEQMLSEVLEQMKPQDVLDVGANTGHYSAIAARANAAVIAIDSDPVVVGENWRRAKGEGLNILPLVQDLARPIPSLGWCNREQGSFLDRAAGAFDLVLMYGVLHHLLIRNGIPLNEVLDLAAKLTRDSLLIEYVGPEDTYFQKICHGRDFRHLTKTYFETHCRKQFEVVSIKRIEGSDRWLFWLRKRGRHAPRV